MTVLSNLKYYYLDLGTQGRGEPVRLLLRDAGIPFQDNRLEYGDWLALKAKIAKDYPVGAMPLVITEDNEYYGLTAPLMRLIGRELGYDGAGKKETHFVEQVADLTSDWFQDCVRLFFQPEQREFHNNHLRGAHVERIERLYGFHSDGPYLLGSKITYADFMIYVILRQDKLLKNLEDMPYLAKFVEAFENRKNLKEYIASYPAEEPEIVVPI